MLFGDFPVNDDWIFVRQVKAFLQGNFRLHAMLDPSFVAQGLLGTLWAKVFGASFISLQILTLLVTFIFVYGIYKVLRLLGARKSVAVLTLITVFFNPLIYTSAFSFMTENYFLMFFIWTLYFYLKFFYTSRYYYVLLGSFFCALSLLTRHIGLVTFIGFAMAVVLGKKVSYSKARTILVAVAPVVVGVCVYMFWPKYGAHNLSTLFIDPELILYRVKIVLLSLHYFPCFIMPLIIGVAVDYSRKTRVVLIAASLILAVFLFRMDIFPAGNILYIESLHTKSDFRSNFSFFDNVLFKSILSILISFTCIKFLHLVAGTLNRKKPNVVHIFLVLVFIGMFGTVFIGTDFYDRYLLPAFIPFLALFVLVFIKKLSVSKKSVLCLILVAFISIALQHEFMSTMGLKWKQAYALQKDTGYLTQIIVNDTYVNHVVSENENDYSGLIEMRASFDPKCYVQDYTLDSGAGWQIVSEGVDNFIQRHIKNPRIYGGRKKNSMPKAKNNLDILLYNERYFSLLYDLVGKEAYVGSWCIKD
ncbi:MAG: hypothetical protein WC243_01085 [Patescibacteria group bacterium]|jgi:hypothetical protein